ncbi:MAG TPA: HD domain-containing phosphohydrolase [Stellaceae bacterium]|nr:HD domain-containing phosphohydrolase [Stellaceae bacterium]
MVDVLGSRDMPSPAGRRRAEPDDADSGPLIDFLEFIDSVQPPPLGELLHRVLLKARRLTDAEAGSIFVLRGRGATRRLEAGSLQNDAIDLAQENIVLPLTPDSIGGYVALTGETLFIDDLYAIDGRPFAFNRDVDAHLGYVSRTMLCFPLVDEHGAVVAVVQLINRRPPGSARPLPFERRHAALVWPVNHFAGRAIERAALTQAILRKNARLRRQRRIIADLQAETEDAFMLSIRLLAKAAELHDEVTGNHILRVNEYSFALATQLGRPSAWCKEIRYSAQLHDVGKMSVDAAVLKKKGALTAAEWREMRRHPTYGDEILRTSPRLAMAADIARCHHEKWDGSGYPAGLCGEAIPLSARVVAVADVYDALRSPRSYKPGFTHEEACRRILEGDGRINPARHFDPRVLAAFAACRAEMDRIWRSLQDAPAPSARKPAARRGRK